MPKSKLLWLVASGVIGGGSAGSPTIAVYDSANSIAIANGDASPATADGTDFGLTPSLTTVTKTYTIRNTGTAQLNVTAISVPSGYTQLTSLPLNIAAGANATFQVRFDALTPIAYSGNVSITNNSSVTPYAFAITGSALYSARVLATSPQRYNKLDEGSGTTMVDSSTNAFTGSYTGITWGGGSTPPQGGDAPFFDGTNDSAPLSSAAFATAFNFNECTIMIWVKVNAASVWTDAASRFLFRINRDPSNDFRIEKRSTNNTVRFQRIGGGTTKTLDVGSQSSTGWICYAISVSIAGGGLLSAGDLRCYANGVQVGATQTGNVAATNSGLNAANTILGAVTAATQVWYGYEGHFTIWDSPMSNDKLALMTV